jgi:hypothetical protein
MNFIATIRQWFYPAEFRIDPPRMPLKFYSILEQYFGSGDESERRGRPKVQVFEMSGPPGEFPQFLAQLGTQLWRLKQNMVAPGTDEPLEEMRRAWRHLESLWELVAEMDVEIRDHTGLPYQAGMTVAVVAFQPTEGVTHEQIVETIRPTIYYKKQILQVGEVVVASPPAAAGERS